MKFTSSDAEINSLEGQMYRVSRDADRARESGDQDEADYLDDIYHEMGEEWDEIDRRNER